MSNFVLPSLWNKLKNKKTKMFETTWMFKSWFLLKWSYWNLTSLSTHAYKSFSQFSPVKCKSSRQILLLLYQFVTFRYQPNSVFISQIYKAICYLDNLFNHLTVGFHYRSSCPVVPIFTVKHLHQSLFFNKVPGLRYRWEPGTGIFLWILRNF